MNEIECPICGCLHDSGNDVMQTTTEMQILQCDDCDTDFVFRYVIETYLIDDTLFTGI